MNATDIDNSTLKDAEIEDAMSAARIPKIYRKKNQSLGEHGDTGKVLKKWVETTAAQDIRSGHGQFIVTQNGKSIDVFFLLARAILLCGVPTKIVSVSTLLDLGSKEDFRESLGYAEALFILGFYIDGPKGSGCPMTDPQRYWLEWFLSSTIRDGRAVMFQSTRPLLSCDWYSPSFLQLIKEHTSEIYAQSLQKSA